MAGPSPNADAPRNVTKYLGQNYQFVPGYTRSRDPTTGDIRDPKNQGYYPKPAIWINSTNQNLWALVKIANNLATWILFSTGGSGPIVHIAVDASTAPGTNPVLPTSLGVVTITGAQVATGTIGANVIRTNSVAANQFNIEIQRTTAVAAADSTKNGVSHFNSAQFSVAGTGFVTLAGGTTAPVLSITTDDADVVVPNGSGSILMGNSLSNTIRTIGSVANTVKPIVSYTNKTFLYGKGLGTEASTIGPLTDGQIIIGSTAGDSAAATLTAGTGISITNGSNSITIASNASPMGTPGVFNTGINYNAGTFTVESATGSAWTTAVPLVVTLPHPTNIGQFVTLTLPSSGSLSYTFTDAAGTNEIGANLWGTTAATAWNQDCPFYIYVALKSTNDDVSFMISRVPGLTVTPVAGNISVAGNTNASTQGSMFALKKNGSTITAANYASVPCLCVGSFRMQKSGADAWTVQTLNFTGDGINNFNENTVFKFPFGQNGAAAGTNWINNGGTAPVFAGTGYNYVVSKNGKCFLQTNLINCTAAGVGAVAARLSLPLNISSSYGVTTTDSALNDGTTNTLYAVISQNSSTFLQFGKTGSTTTMVNTEVTNSATTVFGCDRIYEISQA